MKTLFWHPFYYKKFSEAPVKTINFIHQKCINMKYCIYIFDRFKIMRGHKILISVSKTMFYINI